MRIQEQRKTGREGYVEFSMVARYASGTMFIDSNGPSATSVLFSGVEGKRYFRKMLTESRQNLTDAEIEQLIESVDEYRSGQRSANTGDQAALFLRSAVPLCSERTMSPKPNLAPIAGPVELPQGVALCTRSVRTWSQMRSFAGHQKPLPCRQWDDAIHWPDLRSVDFTATAKQNSSLNAVDASLKEAELSSSDFPGFAMVRRVR